MEDIIEEVIEPDLYSIDRVIEQLDVKREEDDIFRLWESLYTLYKLGYFYFYKEIGQQYNGYIKKVIKFDPVDKMGNYKDLINVFFKRDDITKYYQLLYRMVHNKTSEYMFADFLEAYPEVKFMYEKHCDGVDRAGILKALLNDKIIDTTSQAAFLTKDAHAYKSDAALKQAGYRAKKNN